MLHDNDLRHWRQCPRRLWLGRRRPETALQAPVQAERADAAEVGGATPTEALQASYPGAQTLTPPGTSPAGLSDAEWDRLQSDAVQALRGAPLHAHPDDESADTPVWRPLIGVPVEDAHQALRCRIDLMVPGPRGWKVLMVRHATVGHEVDVDQLVLWARLVERLGVPVAGVGLLLIDTDFVYPGHGLYAGVYREVDLGEALLGRDGRTWPMEMVRTLASPEPAHDAGTHCRQPERCPHLSHCVPPPPAAPQPFTHANDPASGPLDRDIAHSHLLPPEQDALDIVGRELADTLRAEGCSRLSDVPPGRLTEPRHLRAWTAVREQRPVVSPGAARSWAEPPGPRYFLRFETIGFAIPLWPGTRPYQVLPFQWSLAIQAQAEAPLQHAHFLARPQDGDPRRAFAVSLLTACPTPGPVLVYNAGFERNRLRELARAFDDLSEDLLALEARIVDLFQAARSHLYHPAMAGSWSMRSVLDAIAPKLGAGHFDVEGCHSPLAAFALSLQKQLPAPRSQALKAALIEHGQRQTAGVARLCRLLETAADRA